MDRIKEIAALAPFVALALAVSYLQGYWGVFEILPFPYLSLPELLGYSAAPLFGFVIFVLFGSMLAVAGALDDRRRGVVQQPASLAKNPWPYLSNTMIILMCVVLIYRDMPEKWLLTPLTIVGIATVVIFQTNLLDSAIKSHPTSVLALLAVLFLLPGSFGWGRMKALRLVRDKEAGVQITLDSGVESGVLLGRLGTQYFFLNSGDHVSILSETSVKRIDYRKTYTVDPGP